MKLTRATYPSIFAIIIFMLIRITIKQFSEEFAEQIFFPTLIIFIILLLVSIAFIIKDKEFIHVVTDERTKKVDQSAGYYSWWFTIIFAYVYGTIAYIMSFTITQYVFVLISEMFVTMLVFHMYFNFKGEL